MGRPDDLYLVKTHSPRRVPSWSPVKTFHAPLRERFGEFPKPVEARERTWIFQRRRSDLRRRAVGKASLKKVEGTHLRQDRSREQWWSQFDPRELSRGPVKAAKS